MPWMEVSTVFLRQEFVVLAQKERANIRELCRRYDVSPKTGHKWINRYQKEGYNGLLDRSRRPHRSPDKTPEHMEQVVLKIRDRHPAWGGRKIHSRLGALGYTHVPSPSTITAILKRYGRINPEEAQKHKPYRRFEYDNPNGLWQMDFKGYITLPKGRCYPLSVLDDHSRFAIGVEACGNQNGTTVQARLSIIFERYGLPDIILVDNGPPWGSDAEHPYTPLTAWLIRLGVSVFHSRPFHPQTLGKDERFHRTLKAEVIRNQVFSNLFQCQVLFDRWRYIYNFERPHEALEMAVPASRYRPSSRSFPKPLPTIEYGPDDIVRKVQAGGDISFRGRTISLPKAFRGYPVALRPTTTVDGIYNVYFCHQKIAKINLRDHHNVS